MSNAEEVEAPRLAIYVDGTFVTRTGTSIENFRYLKGTLSDTQLASLTRAAVACFGDPEFQPFFDQVQGFDFPTTAIVLHAHDSAAATMIYGAGLFSVLDLGDKIDFLPDVLGLPQHLCRLLIELALVDRQGQTRWDNIPRDMHGVPIFPSSSLLTGDAIVPSPHSSITYTIRG